MERQNIYVHGSIPEFENDGDDLDRYYIPARSLAYLPQDPEALYVLPNHPPVIEYYQQLKDIHRSLGTPAQGLGNVFFVPDDNYLLDQAIFGNITEFKKYLNRYTRYSVHPYASTDNLQQWVESLRVDSFNMEEQMPQKLYYDDIVHPSHRGGWGRHISALNQPSFPEQFLLPYPKSLIASGLDEITEAYWVMLSKTHCPSLFFKPVFSAGGFTIKEVSSIEEVIEHYNHLKTQGALDILGRETPVELQEKVSNIKGIFSLQYEGEQITTPNTLCVQIIKDNSWQGNIFRPKLNSDLVYQVNEIFYKFVQGLKSTNGQMKGSGGIDFVLQEIDGEERLLIIEHNGRRITGGHPAIALAEGLDVYSPYMTQKSPGEPNCDLQTLWKFLEVEHLSYDSSTKRGIFPIIWMKGSGMLWVAEESTDMSQSILDKTYIALGKNGYIN